MRNNKTSTTVWAEETLRFLRSKQWKLIRDLTFIHFAKKCMNCGSTEKIHLDHIIARVNDNTGERWLDITNLQPLCEYCNSTIKGRKNTDYRTEEDKLKAQNLKSLFENTLHSKGFDSYWVMWEDKKRTKRLNTQKAKTRSEWKIKIRSCIKSGMQYADIIRHYELITSTPDYKYITNYINKKIKDTKIRLLDELYIKRESLSKEQLVRAIEVIATVEVIATAR